MKLKPIRTGVFDDGKHQIVFRDPCRSYFVGSIKADCVKEFPTGAFKTEFDAQKFAERIFGEGKWIPFSKKNMRDVNV